MAADVPRSHCSAKNNAARLHAISGRKALSAKEMARTVLRSMGMLGMRLLPPPTTVDDTLAMQPRRAANQGRRGHEELLH